MSVVGWRSAGDADVHRRQVFYGRAMDHPTIDTTAMISWSTLQTLLLVVGPFAWSKGRSFYNSSRVTSMMRRRVSAALSARAFSVYDL